jgi:hypothetical protein
LQNHNHLIFPPYRFKLIYLYIKYYEVITFYNEEKTELWCCDYACRPDLLVLDDDISAVPYPISQISGSPLSLWFSSCNMIGNLLVIRLVSEQLRSWSDCADAQAGLDPCWSETHFVGFVVTRLIFISHKDDF